MSAGGFVAGRACDRATAEGLISQVFYETAANLNDHERAPFAACRPQIAAYAIIDRSQRVPRTTDSKEPGANPDQRTIEYRSRLFRLVEQLLKSQRWFIA